MQTPSEATISQDPVVLQPLPREEWPSIDHIITEDGAPVDNVFSEKQMRLLTESLYASWKVDRPYVAFANVGLFYGINFPPLVPDVLLSVDVRLPENLFPKMNRSYFVWGYGKPPEVVIEIVSNRKGNEDTDKLKLYADIRVANYFIYDPENHLSSTALRGFRLRGSHYEPFPQGDFRIEEVGLKLTLWEGRYEDTDSVWLRWTDNQGNLIATGAERAEAEARRAESEYQRAETQAQRAEAESQRAEAESQRAETESQRAEVEFQRAEAETQRAEAESQRAEVEFQRAEAETQRAGSESQLAKAFAGENQRLLELLRRNGIDPTT